MPSSSDATVPALEVLSAAKFLAIYPTAARMNRFKAMKLIGHYQLLPQDCADIEQELLLDQWRRWSKYDASRSNPATFLDRLIRNKIASIVERRVAQKRHYGKSRPLLEAESDGKSTCRAEESSHADLFGQTYNPGTDRQERMRRMHLIADVARVVAALPPPLKDLALLLRAEMNIAQCARRLKLSRSRAHTLVEEIRMRFNNAGLSEYL